MIFHIPNAFAFFGFTIVHDSLASPKNGLVESKGILTVKRALDISSFVKLASSSATSWRYMQSVSLHCWPFKNLNFYVISRTEGTLDRGYDRFYSFRYFVRPWTLKEIVDGVWLTSNSILSFQESLSMFDHLDMIHWLLEYISKQRPSYYKSRRRTQKGPKRKI